jgi:chemosensory pili system protein ChpA (sensor histidine kinase/response regulator)/putative two-component system response regulator
MEKILIIDDNPTDRFIQQKMLEAHYDVHVASNPMDGADIIRDWHPDIIVVDYAMPEMNGIQAIKYYKQKMKYDGIYLILTGLDDINIATEAIRRGAYDYLVKPLVSTIFNHKIKNCVNYRKLLKSEREKIANAAIERIILTIYYEMKPIHEKLNEITEKLLAKNGGKDLANLKKYLDNLGNNINKLGDLDKTTKKEYVDNILSYYLE